MIEGTGADSERETRTRISRGAYVTLLLCLGPGILIAAVDFLTGSINALFFVLGIAAVWLQWPVLAIVAIGLLVNPRMRRDRRVWLLLGATILAQIYLIRSYSKGW